MIVHSTLLAAVAALAPVPPTPPPPPALPAAAAAAPTPPVPPPGPPADVWMGGRGGREVVSRDVDGHRVTVIARSGGAGPDRPVLDYRDAQGRDVQVYADRPVSREEADRLLSDARVQGERAREQGRMARDAGARARLDAERLRGEALETARRAVEAARLSSRDYADLRDVRVMRFAPGDGPQTWVDGRRVGPGFAERPQLRELREEVQALRGELKALRAELDRVRDRR